ncbi:GNAT family N-acetyltransferase [Aeromicrobium sp. CF4.19]|uniref:GNAT family N-acetyltransferase n=1 Tax=Aeromicrobium sp. CF4.19 TaxID=3373082 RepID=UPI003EE4B147
MHRLEPEEWLTWRALRRRALHEDPGAFAASTALWTGADDVEARWSGRIAAARACFVAHRSGVPVGMVAADPSPGGGPGLVLASMWVAREARRLGVGRRLVEAVLGQAGGADVRLRVMADNVGAVEAYERCGFRLVGTPVDEEGCLAMVRPGERPAR